MAEDIFRFFSRPLMPESEFNPFEAPSDWDPLNPKPADELKSFALYNIPRFEDLFALAAVPKIDGEELKKRLERLGKELPRGCGYETIKRMRPNRWEPTKYTTCYALLECLKELANANGHDFDVAREICCAEFVVVNAQKALDNCQGGQADLRRISGLEQSLLSEIFKGHRVPYHIAEHTRFAIEVTLRRNGIRVLSSSLYLSRSKVLPEGRTRGTMPVAFGIYKNRAVREPDSLPKLSVAGL